MRRLGMRGRSCRHTPRDAQAGYNPAAWKLPEAICGRLGPMRLLPCRHLLVLNEALNPLLHTVENLNAFS